MSLFTIASLPYQVFPGSPGYSWGLKRNPSWKTIVQESVSGLDSGASCMQYPVWKGELNYKLLKSDSVSLEFQTIVGFFNQCHGAAIPFCFLDSVDNAINTGTFGTGDGSSTVFQLFRIMGGFYEPVLS